MHQCDMGIYVYFFFHLLVYKDSFFLCSVRKVLCAGQRFIYQKYPELRKNATIQNPSLLLTNGCPRAPKKKYIFVPNSSYVVYFFFFSSKGKKKASAIYICAMYMRIFFYHQNIDNFLFFSPSSLYNTPFFS